MIPKCKTERFKNSFLVRACIDNEFYRSVSFVNEIDDVYILTVLSTIQFTSWKLFTNNLCIYLSMYYRYKSWLCFNDNVSMFTSFVLSGIRQELGGPFPGKCPTKAFSCPKEYLIPN